MRKWMVFAAALAFTPLAQGQEGDPEAGKGKSTVCASCHGQDGISTAPIYPNLAGQKEQYLVTSIKAYKNQQREGGQSAVMYPMVSGLSEQDILDLAAYYASLPPGGAE
ncbi:c-type cytochrome [Arhodomonas sp. SL1]|uniref:c-type cytochrome n=1 Tax=Arhodomonas sp. SL1 TaxID=3425691 RepID=UPI003F880606